MRQQFIKKPPYLPVYVADYLADTQELTAEEHGIYLLLMMAAWRTSDCGLPLDHNKLARIVGMTPRAWKARCANVLALWTIDGDRIYQRRLLAERADAEDRSSQASKAARERWDRENSDEPLQNLHTKNAISPRDSGNTSAEAQGGQVTENIETEAEISNADAYATQTQTHKIDIEEVEGRQEFELLAPDGKPPPDIVDVVIKAWNGAATRCGPLRACQAANEDRRKGIRALVAEHGLDTVVDVINRLPEQGYIAAGGTNGDWRPTIDFLFRKTKFVKIMEGQYGTRPGKKSGWA